MLFVECGVEGIYRSFTRFHKGIPLENVLQEKDSQYILIMLHYLKERINIRY